MPAQDTVTKVEIWPIDVPITDPFVVATGRLVTAQNLFVRVTLKDGSRGYGEIAPFPEVGGEDRDTCRQIAAQLAKAALGQPASQYSTIARLFQGMAASHPASCCGLETALLDALCRHTGVPLWGFWGGADVRERETDVTIPIADLERTVALAREWYRRGFRLFKTKVGADVHQDVRRLEAVHRALPDIAFIADANQGFTREDCLAFVNGVQRVGGRIVLLEQPVARDDLEGLAALRHLTGIPVAADESVRSLQDAKDVVHKQAADYINIKIMKSGVIEALAIATFAREAGLRLMIGGMVETRIAMGCSFGLVLGLGGFDVLDLDTPLLLAADPVEGGYRYDGPRLLPWSGPGLDLEAQVADTVITIE
jgi:o-succinylbenzoate synthase